MACLRYLAPFFPYYTRECSLEWCYCFENKENMTPIQPNPSHPNVAASNRAPAKVVHAPPMAHHRKIQPPEAPCAGWNDCAGENYVYKVPSSAPRQTQSQPGTCTWLANVAAVAVASSAIGAQCQRGQCLAESNSTLSASGLSPILPTRQLRNSPLILRMPLHAPATAPTSPVRAVLQPTEMYTRRRLIRYRK